MPRENENKTAQFTNNVHEVDTLGFVLSKITITSSGN